MRELREKTAIRLTLKMWRWLAKTGKVKQEYFDIVDKRENQPCMLCFLCEYAEQHRTRMTICHACPYYKRYGRCINADAPRIDPTHPYSVWSSTDIPDSRKKWASECGKQLEALVTGDPVKKVTENSLQGMQ